MFGLSKLGSIVIALLVLWSIVASIGSIYAFMRLGSTKGELATSVAHLSECQSVNENNVTELAQLQLDIDDLSGQLKRIGDSAEQDQRLAQQQREQRESRAQQSQQDIAAALSGEMCADVRLPAVAAERLRSAANHARRAGAGATGAGVDTGAGASDLPAGSAHSASDLRPVRAGQRHTVPNH